MAALIFGTVTGGEEWLVPAVRPMILGLLVVLPMSMGSLPAGSSPTFPGANLSCVGLDHPSDGVITNRFEPGPGYEGHWGIDYSGDSDGYARAATGGRVSFVGDVAGNLVVSVDHGGGLVTSYSYLGRPMVTRGQRLARGTVVGLIGQGSLHDGLHFSVRIMGTYADPEQFLGCQPRSPSVGLRLVPVDRSRLSAASATGQRTDAHVATGKALPAR